MNASTIGKGLVLTATFALSLLGLGVGIDDKGVKLAGPTEAQAHDTNNVCWEQWDDVTAKQQSYHKYKNSFFSASKLKNGAIVKCEDSGGGAFNSQGYDGPCWNWRSRCGTNYNRLDEVFADHGHFWWEEGIMDQSTATLCDPTPLVDNDDSGYVKPGQGYSNGNCPPDSFYTNLPIRHMHQHVRSTAITVWSENWSDHKPTIMDVEYIQFLPPENNPTCLPAPNPNPCTKAKLSIKNGPLANDWMVWDQIPPNEPIPGQPGQYYWYDIRDWSFEVERVEVTEATNEGAYPLLGGIYYSTPSVSGWGMIDICGNNACSSTESCTSCPEDCAVCAVPNATYKATSTSGCTGSAPNCVAQSWGVDLNDNTGYKWTVDGGTGGLSNLYVKVASPSGTRRMSLWVNGTQIFVLQTDATQSPRPTGKELGPFTATLRSGTNTIELKDDQGTAELDVHHVRLDTSPPEQTIAANTVTGCTNAADCTLQSWGIDLNADTGYLFTLEGGAVGGVTNVAVKVASESGTRSMDLFLHGDLLETITTDATDSPRSTGKEFGPFRVQLSPGTNSLELIDSQGTEELDVLQARTNNKVPDFTYLAQSTLDCTGTDCTRQTWGIDLNANTGYHWDALGGSTGGPAKLYVKVASPSGTRSMSLRHNGNLVAVITASSSTSPRPTGRELGPFNVTLDGSSNSVELWDDQGTAELDVHYLRVAE
ncbi:MAG TPA: hypothetical protein VJN18_04585 [Polyangiaceae bacterium]|nr:hypothetical protein [Polyangiaceae bacterium]